MLKKIFSYGFIEGIAKGLNKLILLLLPFFLGTADFGKVGLILSIETLLPLVTLLGFERAILRFYASRDSIRNFDKTLNVAINITHIGVLIVLGVIYLMGIKSIFGLDLFPDLFLLLVLVYFQATNLIVLNKLRVNEEHSKYYKSRLFLQIGKFLFVLLLVFITNSYLGYLIGGIIIAAITNIFFKVRLTNMGEQKFDSKTFKYIFSFSWPFIFHGIAINLLGNADKFILERFLSIEHVGQYTFIYSIGSMMVFGFVGISVYLEPLIYKASELQKERYIHDYLLYGTVISTILYLIIGVFSTYLVQHIYAEEYQKFVHLIPMIAISFLLYPHYLTANYRMIYYKKTKKIAILSILTCICNIWLNFLFIPKYGLFASVLVTYISYFLQAVLFTYISNGMLITKQVFEIICLAFIFFLTIYFNIHFLIVVIILICYSMYLYFTGKMSARL